jgi:hypothetical protein
MKTNFMKTLSAQLPETVKIAIAVILVYGTIALVTYLVW